MGKMKWTIIELLLLVLDQLMYAQPIYKLNEQMGRRDLLYGDVGESGIF